MDCLFRYVFIFLAGVSFSASYADDIITMQDTPPVAVDNEFFVGNPNAKATIYEYGSLTCHVCSKFYLKILPKLLKDLGGKIKIIVRPFPFNALDVAGAKLILYSDKPHELSEFLYEKQEQWLGADEQINAMKQLAIEFGMDPSRVENALKDENLERAVLSKRLVVKSKSAPVFKIGKSNIEGLPHWPHFKKLIQAYIEHIECDNTPESFDALKFFEDMPTVPEEDS